MKNLFLSWKRREQNGVQYEFFFHVPPQHIVRIFTRIIIEIIQAIEIVFVRVLA